MLLKKILKFLAYLLACMLFAIPMWINREFGTVSVDQVLYHLSFGSTGLFASDPALMDGFIRFALLLPLGLALLLFVCEAFVTHAHRHGLEATLLAIRQTLANWGRMIRTGLLHALKGANFAFQKKLHLILLGGGIIFFGYQFSLISYISSFYGEDYFAGSYVDPRQIELKKERPKSLVLIYVESLENTYADPSRFGKDLLHRLTALQEKGVSFNHYTQMPGTGWTIAGIVSSQCGLPLRSLAMFDGNQQGEHVSSFLPNARCLGDILNAHGYTNIFMNGSSLEFAGVGKFFKDHHYKRVYGREEWIGLGEKQETMSGWGLHDDDLFRNARAELAKQIRSRKLFNLTLLTIDTHHPYGHLSTTCNRRGFTDFEGIVECTADQVAEFVEDIISNGWLDKVSIVIQGDHLAMGNTSYEKLISNPDRTVFNLLISGDKKLVKNTDDFSHFDMFPTILDLIGLKVVGERAGLGYSGLGVPKVERPADRREKMEALLMNYSKDYEKLWGPNTDPR